MSHIVSSEISTTDDDNSIVKCVKTLLTDVEDMIGSGEEKGRRIRVTIRVEDALSSESPMESKECEKIEISLFPLNARTGLVSIKSSPKPNNGIAAKLWMDLRKKGWKSTRRGWPDTFAINPDTGAVIAVEIASQRGRTVRIHQSTVLHALAQLGMPCYVWSEQKGYRRITPKLDESRLVPQLRNDNNEGAI